MKFLSRSLLLLFIIISSRESFSQVVDSKSFLDSLSESTLGNIPTETEEDKFWHSLTDEVDPVYVFNKKIFKGDKAYGESSPIFFPKPNTELLFKRKLLINDVEVVQQKHTGADGRIAVALCFEGKPTIFFSSVPDPRLCEEALAFFREHEYAHLKLGHSNCSADATETNISRLEKEKAADLEAARTILAIPDGHIILRYVIGALYGMNIKSKSTHPSSRDRADYIIKEFSR